MQYLFTGTWNAGNVASVLVVGNERSNRSADQSKFHNEGEADTNFTFSVLY